MDRMEYARPGFGFEPATCSFGGCHSIQLSYGRDALILLGFPLEQLIDVLERGGDLQAWR